MGADVVVQRAQRGFVAVQRGVLAGARVPGLGPVHALAEVVAQRHDHAGPRAGGVLIGGRVLQGQ